MNKRSIRTFDASSNEGRGQPFLASPGNFTVFEQESRPACRSRRPARGGTRWHKPMSSSGNRTKWPPKPLRYVQYCRSAVAFSEERSLDRQKAVNDAYAKHLGFISAIGRSRYVDRGGGGIHTSERPALAQLLADAAKGCFDVVVVEDFGRLARDIGHLRRIFDALGNSGVELHETIRGRCVDIEFATGGGRTSRGAAGPSRRSPVGRRHEIAAWLAHPMPGERGRG